MKAIDFINKKKKEDSSFVNIMDSCAWNVVEELMDEFADLKNCNLQNVSQQSELKVLLLEMTDNQKDKIISSSIIQIDGVQFFRRDYMLKKFEDFINNKKT